MPVTEPIVFPGAGSTIDLRVHRGELPSPVETCRHAHPAANYSQPGLPLIAMLPQSPGADLTARLTSPDGSNGEQHRAELVCGHGAHLLHDRSNLWWNGPVNPAEKPGSPRHPTDAARRGSLLRGPRAGRPRRRGMVLPQSPCSCPALRHNNETMQLHQPCQRPTRGHRWKSVRQLLCRRLHAGISRGLEDDCPLATWRDRNRHLPSGARGAGDPRSAWHRPKHGQRARDSARVSSLQGGAASFRVMPNRRRVHVVLDNTRNVDRTTFRVRTTSGIDRSHSVRGAISRTVVVPTAERRIRIQVRVGGHLIASRYVRP